MFICILILSSVACVWLVVLTCVKFFVLLMDLIFSFLAGSCSLVFIHSVTPIGKISLVMPVKGLIFTVL